MAKFRKKPVVIDAMQFSGDNQEEIEQFCPGIRRHAEDARAADLGHMRFMFISTAEGEMRAAPFDWIIRGVKGEFYPCKPDIFDATYEAVGEAGQSFGWAIKQMQNGARVQRDGWNGKGMYLYLEDMLSHEVKVGAFAGSVRIYEPCIVMFTAQGKHQPGWLASQADMLATDWRTVES